MNKYYLLLLLLAIQSLMTKAQDFEIRANKADGEKIDVQDKKTKVADFEVKSLFVRCTTPGQAATTFKICFDDTCIPFSGNALSEKNLPGKPDIREKTIAVKSADEATTHYQFKLLKKRTFEIKTSKNTNTPEIGVDESTNESRLALKDPVNKIFITLKEPVDPDFTYRVFINNEAIAPFPGSGNPFEISSAKFPDLRDKVIQVRDEAGTPVYTVTVKGSQTVANNGNRSTASLRSAVEEIRSKFPVLGTTVYGLKVPSGNKNTSYSGSKYIHIFLDQFGNNVFSTIPQGVANRQYVVHIFYLENEADPNQVDYSINQTAGEFQETLVFNNAGQLGTLNLRSKDDEGQEIKYRWAHKEFILSTATTNIVFDVVRTALKSEQNFKQEFETQTLRTYTIKMSKVYHGSFDVGLINTTLENPDFVLVTSPVNPAQTIVKKNDGKNRGVVTAMATFYTSPVILLESLFGSKEIPNYMLSGRNFLEDHKLYERIYPAIGVGFTDKTLENLFFGFDWEFARGGSIFAGWHYGKVNIFNAPPNFQFENTPVTADDFNLRTNTAWKTKFAFGLNVDIMIIRNLFRPAAAGGGDSQ